MSPLTFFLIHRADCSWTQREGDGSCYSNMSERLLWTGWLPHTHGGCRRLPPGVMAVRNNGKDDPSLGAWEPGNSLCHQSAFCFLRLRRKFTACHKYDFLSLGSITPQTCSWQILQFVFQHISNLIRSKSRQKRKLKDSYSVSWIQPEKQIFFHTKKNTLVFYLNTDTKSTLRNESI